MSALTRKLLAKELYLNRWLMLATTVGGLASVGIATLGNTGFNIGSLTWMTTVVVLGVMLGLHGLINERKDRSLLFTLSLPLSASDYLRAKLWGLLLCFLMPWLALSIGAVGLVLLTPVPDGLLPLVVLLCLFLLTNFSLVLCGGLLTTSEGAFTAIIITTNMGVTLFMFMVGGIPAIHEHLRGAVPQWNGAFRTVALTELAVLALAVLIPFVLAGRRRGLI